MMINFYKRSSGFKAKKAFISELDALNHGDGGRI